MEITKLWEKISHFSEEQDNLKKALKSLEISTAENLDYVKKHMEQEDEDRRKDMEVHAKMLVTQQLHADLLKDIKTTLGEQHEAFTAIKLRSKETDKSIEEIDEKIGNLKLMLHPLFWYVTAGSTIVAVTIYATWDEFVQEVVKNFLGGSNG
jgi:chromosome segregation ATPase